MRIPGTKIIVPMMLLLAANAVRADDAGHIESFAKGLVDAIASNSVEQQMEIIHPLSRACMTEENQPYYEWVFTRRAKLVKANNYKVTTSPIDKVPTMVLADGQLDFPQRPTHQIQVDFVTGPYSSSTVIFFVAHDGKRWREVLPCPRHGDVAARVRDKQIGDQRQTLRAKSLAASMPDPLKSEIAALLKEGRKVAAIRRYAAATGEDVGTAKSVVEMLGAR